MTSALRAADLSPSGWLEPGDLAVILRSAYDPVVAGALERYGDLGRHLPTAGPVAVSESRSSVRSDSARHCVLWSASGHAPSSIPGSSLPSCSLRAYAAHFRCSSRRCVRTKLQGTSERRRPSTFPTQPSASGLARSNAQQGAEYNDVLQQEADLTAGHGILRTTGLIAVSAWDPDELGRAVADIEQAAIQASCETRRLWGQQAQAFSAAALPLCRRV